MNTKKDEPGKKTDPEAAGPRSGRPHATLDLKATVVGDKSAKEEKAATGAAGAAASAPRASEPAAPGAAKAGTQKPGDTGAAAKTGPQGSAADPPQTAARHASGFLSHLAAGVAGGIVALLAADLLASQLGLGAPGEPAEAPAALQQRLAALEERSKEGAAAPQLASRLAAAETKLGQLQKLSGNVDRLAKSQGELSRNVNALDAKVGAQDGEGGTAARVARLEEQLTQLSAAAERDPDGAGLPQLAAITGKIADLESTTTNQLDALRQSVNEEISTRLAAANEASEAAKSGTQRIDREMAGVKADTALITAHLNTLNAEASRTSAALRAAQEELTRIKADLNARLPGFAKPEDVSAAVNPIADKLSALQHDIQGVVESEGQRKATAGRIVLSLELANLKRAIDRGRGFAPELEQARKLSDGSLDLAPLGRFATTGVPTLAELRQNFRAVAFKIIEADATPADGSIVERLLAGARSVVRVRKVSHDDGDKSVEAVVARMETALNEDRLDDVIKEAKTLPQPAQAAAQDFLAKVEARNAVDQALSTVEAQLKASLVAPAAAGGKPQE